MVLRIIAGTAAIISIFALSGCMGVSNANFSAWCPSGAPCSVSYSTATQSYTVNEVMSIGASVSGGTPSTYSISPSLPTGLGLSFDTTTGTISGTPTETTSSTTYTITATNDSGSASTTVTFAIVAQPVLTISPSIATLTVGRTLTFTASNGTSPYTFAKTAGSGSTSGNSFTLTAPTTPTPITVTVTDSSAPTPQTASATVAVVAGTASQLVWVTQPSLTGTPGAALSTQPVLKAEDAYGNVVTGYASIVAIMPYTASGCAAEASVTDTGNAATPTSGVATFSAYDIDTDGSYYYMASSGSLTTACSSSPIVISGSTGTATQIIYNTLPSNAVNSGQALFVQPVLQVEDTHGNVVTSASNPITLAAYTNSACTTPASGTVSATTNPLDATSGIATFTGAIYTGTAGTIYLGATDTADGLTPACSGAITVSAGSASKLAFTTEPSPSASTGVSLVVSPQVSIEDASSNVVTTASNSITLAAYTNSSCTTAASGTLSANFNPLSATSGVASFSGVTYTGSAGTIYLGVSATGLTSGCSAAITVTAGSCDDQLGTVTNGSMLLSDPSAGIWPTCNGGVLVGDPGQSSITYYDALSDGSVLISYTGLSVPPGQLLYDSTNNLLYAGAYNAVNSSATTLTQINMNTSGTTDIDVGGAPAFMAMASNGNLFVSAVTEPSNPEGNIVYVNGLGPSVNHSFTSDLYEVLLAFNTTTNELYTGGYELSGSWIYRYLFATGSPDTLTEQEINDTNVGDNATTLLLSTDGSHLVQITATGDSEGTPRVVYDYNPSDVNGTTNGTFSTGSSNPLTSGAFSPDGTLLAVSDTANVYVFNVSDHALSTTFSPTLCSGGSISQVAFSLGGKVLFAYANCSSGGALYWTSP